MWSLIEAIDLVQEVQGVALLYNYHVCLGGSVLHEYFSNKDVDIYFLPMHGMGKPRLEELIGALDQHWGISRDLKVINESSQYPDEPGYVAARTLFWKIDPSRRIDFWVVGESYTTYRNSV